MDEAATFHSNGRANGIIATALYDKLTSDPRIDLMSRARQLATNP
jgi:hypothetical protein